MSQTTRARRFMTACFVASAALVAAQTPPAQTPAAQPPSGAAPAQAGTGQPTFRTEANFVLTDVFVTADGKPVTDLTQQDFEVKEDGVVQTIRSFEHMQLGGTQTAVPRRSPSSVAESRAVAADPRRRVFILFLDTFHVSRASSMEVRETIRTFLTKILLPDDLIGLVTPQMAGGDISFSTSTDSIISYLDANPVWGVKDELPGAESDPVERDLQTCFTVGNDQAWLGIRSRMREERSLKAMRDLVRHLDGLRESRKAIITVTEGWNLFRENPTRMTDRDTQGKLPGVQAIGVGPDGRLGTPERYKAGGSSQYTCDTLRMNISFAESQDLFRELIGEANRSNASFYTVDAARLRAGMQRPVLTGALDSTVEMRNRERMPLSNPLDHLKTLGEATNGLVVADTNNLSAGLQRVADDFNSFYLLGYNSTNGKQDGGYRKIKVTVKRPGVEVRAREGYRASRADEITRGPGSGAVASPTGDEALVSAALGRLVPMRPGVPFVVYASAGMAPSGRVIRVVAELDAAIARGDDWVEGGEAQALVRGLKGDTLTSAQAKIEPGGRAVQLEMPVPADLSGDIKVQVRLMGSGALARYTDTTTVRVEPVGGDWGAPLVQRRGPTTGTAWVPTADLRFRRQERVRVSVGHEAADPEVTGALLDRKGKPIDVPVRVNRPEPAGLVAELSLAPLAAGDYVIAIGAGAGRLFVPFRVIP